MRLVPAIAILLLALSGCSDPPQYAEAKQAAAAKFPYPSSAEFRGVKFMSISSEKSPWVCGEVRAKGLNGEFTGYRRFSWSREHGATVEGETDNPALAPVIDTIVECT